MNPLSKPDTTQKFNGSLDNILPSEKFGGGGANGNGKGPRSNQFFDNCDEGPDLPLVNFGYTNLRNKINHDASKTHRPIKD